MRVKRGLAFFLTIILVMNSFVLVFAEESNSETGQESIETTADDPQYGRSTGSVDDGFYDFNGMSLFNSTTGLNSSTYIHDSRFNGYSIRNGIDVSVYQGTIDWAKVKAAGIDFAFIRVGYRGYGSGSLCDDTKYIENLQGAINAGIKVGVYIFSQAISTSEAVEEANYILARISGYNITMPVIMDFEYVSGSSGLTGRLYEACLSTDSATAVCQAFCSTVAAAGYTPMIYANKNMLENHLNAAVLSASYKIWLANYTTQTSYGGEYSYWQYSSVGSVDGITGNVDCNFWYDESVVGSQTIANGTYTISSAIDANKVLDIAGGSTSDGANLQIYSKNNTNAQKYQITYLGDGYYTLAVVSSGKVLDVAAAGKANGTNVQQYSSNGSSAQKWVIKSTGDGYYNIIASANGKCLEVSGGNTANGTNIHIWEANGSYAQKFKLTIQGSQTISEGVYTISTALNLNKVLDIAGGSIANGANTQLYSSNTSYAQKFQVIYLGNGYYSLESLSSGKILEVAGGGTGNGTNVQQNSSNGSASQKWVIKSTGDGYYSIISGVSGNYMDVSGASTSDGTNIQTYAPNASAAQKFKFTQSGEQPLVNGNYTISSALNNSKVLDISGGSTASSANLQIYSSNNSNAQKYKVTYLGNGYYSLQALCSSKMLDVTGAGTSNGTNVQQYTSNGSAAQKWIVRSCGNGYYYLISGVSGKCLDVSGGNTANGTNIHTWELNETNAQKFKFINAS